MEHCAQAPVNIAYEAATADLNDVNMIDPWHLEAYGETTVNYNRDVEIFPVLKATFDKIYGKCLTNRLRIWALIWQATVFLMTRRLKKRLTRKSYADFSMQNATKSRAEQAKMRFTSLNFL